MAGIFKIVCKFDHNICFNFCFAVIFVAYSSVQWYSMVTETKVTVVSIQKKFSCKVYVYMNWCSAL